MTELLERVVWRVMLIVASLCAAAAVLYFGVTL